MVKANGQNGSANDLKLEISSSKPIITEDEPTTEWTPEIPFRNVCFWFACSRLQFIVVGGFQGVEVLKVVWEMSLYIPLLGIMCSNWFLGGILLY